MRFARLPNCYVMMRFEYEGTPRLHDEAARTALDCI